MKLPTQTERATAALLIVTMNFAMMATSTNAFAMGKAHTSPNPSASASPSPEPSPSASPSPVPSSFTVNPDNLRVAVLHGNLSLIGELDQVKVVKDQANISQTNLLPELSIGAILAGVTGGASLILTGVSFLIGFLMPSNWTAMKEANALFYAEVESYKILELNTYASSESLYYTILAENQLAGVQEQDYLDLRKLADTLKQEHDLLGAVSDGDVGQAAGAADSSQGALFAMQEAVSQENATMTSVLNFPVSVSLNYEESEAAPSSAETADLQATIDQALKVAPERQQIEYLVTAAQAGKWTQTFSYLGGSATLSAQSTGASSVSLSNLYLHDGLNLGFGIFPTLDLGNDQIRSAELRRDELVNEATMTVTSAVKSLTSDLLQYNVAKSAEANLQVAYDTKMQEYKAGLTTLFEVLSQRTLLTAAQTTRVKAQLDLNLQRLTMHRSLIDDEFAQIPGCKMTMPPKIKSPGVWDWVKSLFGAGSYGKPSDSDLDKDCRA